MKRKGINICHSCRVRAARAKGLCTTCYQRQRRAKLREGLALDAFTGREEPEAPELKTNLASVAELEAIAQDPERYLRQDLGQGRTMEMFKTVGEEIWFRYTFPLCKENSPFPDLDKKLFKKG